MTAYLQPGDKIHMAVPIPSGHKLKAVTSQMDADVDAYTAEYAEQGVEIVSWSAHEGLNAPVIIAVFRDPNGETESEG